MMTEQFNSKKYSYKIQAGPLNIGTNPASFILKTVALAERLIGIGIGAVTMAGGAILIPETFGASMLLGTLSGMATILIFNMAAEVNEIWASLYDIKGLFGDSDRRAIQDIIRLNKQVAAKAVKYKTFGDMPQELRNDIALAANRQYKTLRALKKDLEEAKLKYANKSYRGTILPLSDRRLI